MGRHIKVGLDYMSLDCDIMANRKMRLFLSDFPADKQLEVFAIWVLIMLKLYAGKGYYLPWDEDEQSLFSTDNKLDKSYVNQVVERAVLRGLFNEERYREKQVLTSAEITERYVFAKSGHFSGKIDLSVGVLREEIPIDTESIPISTLKSAQRKEKKRNLCDINPEKKDSSKICEHCGEKYFGDECLNVQCKTEREQKDDFDDGF